MAVYPTGEELYNDAMSNYNLAAALPGYVTRAMKAQNLGTGVSLNTINPMAHVARISQMQYMFHQSRSFAEADVFGYKASAEGTLIKPFLTGIGGKGILGTLHGVGVGGLMGVGLAAAAGVNNPLGYVAAAGLGSAYFGLKGPNGSAGLAGILDHVKIKTKKGEFKGGDFLRKLSGEGYYVFGSKSANSFVKITKQKYGRLVKNKFTGTGIKKINEALSFGSDLNKLIFEGEGEVFGGIINSELNKELVGSLKEAYKLGPEAFDVVAGTINARFMGTAGEQMREVVASLTEPRKSKLAGTRTKYKHAKTKYKKAKAKRTKLEGTIDKDIKQYNLYNKRRFIKGESGKAKDYLKKKIIDLAQEDFATNEERAAAVEALKDDFKKKTKAYRPSRGVPNQAPDFEAKITDLANTYKAEAETAEAAAAAGAKFTTAFHDVKGVRNSILKSIKNRYGLGVHNLRFGKLTKTQQTDLVSSLLTSSLNADFKINYMLQLETQKPLLSQLGEMFFASDVKAARMAEISARAYGGESLKVIHNIETGGGGFVSKLFNRKMTKEAAIQDVIKTTIGNQFKLEQSVFAKHAFSGFNKMISLGFWVDMVGKAGMLAKRTLEHQAIRLAKTASTLHNITHASFGTGVSLQTQQASTERTRAIQAITNSGINARAYLGREAAIVAGA